MTNDLKLNLPSYDVRLAGTRERPTIFDMLRRRYVALTPEEWVRQHFVHFLVDVKGYPATLLANEVRLQIGGKLLRADSVLYDNRLRPRMIIEYKAPQIVLTQRVFDQIMVYNMLLHVDYLIVSNGLEHYCCRMDYEHERYEFLQGIPNYEEL
ncbi:MAG: type I restriction enzyme HsdR N-terminal domain-containing protein [Prevotella sp.]|nr:type I restriction enzyme HsdR N-terminal domain-containing protein [Prevotella sp.]